MNPGVPRGQLGRGSVGNDLNTIPFSAIEKVEILRDGASANMALMRLQVCQYSAKRIDG
jgi:hypothetical protein